MTPTETFLLRLPMALKSQLAVEAGEAGLSLNQSVVQILDARRRINLCGEALAEASHRPVSALRKAYGDDLRAVYRLLERDFDRPGTSGAHPYRCVAVLSASAHWTTRRKNQALKELRREWKNEVQAVVFSLPSPGADPRILNPAWPEVARHGFPVYLVDDEVPRFLRAVMAHEREWAAPSLHPNKTAPERGVPERFLESFPSIST